MYLNQNHTSVADLLQGNEKRLMLLYPVDINLENHFYSKKNLNITDIMVSMVELELSFKQIFFLVLLSQKIFDSVKPMMQVFDNIKRGQKPQASANENQEDPVQAISKKSTMLTMQTGSIYFALIKETSSSMH